MARIEEAACPTCGSCSGMFTANSMNCLTEALGLALPGNGSTLATHTARKQLYQDAGRTAVEICKRYYEQDDATRAAARVATRGAFDNAMTLDVAMGGSTNTILHLLAAAQEAGLDYTMDDIEERSRRVPCSARSRRTALPDGGRAPRRRHPRDPRRARPRRPAAPRRLDRARARRWTSGWTSGTSAAAPPRGRRSSCSTPRPAACARRRRSRSRSGGTTLDLDAADGCIHDVAHAYSRRRRPRGAARQPRRSTAASSRPPAWTSRS